MSKELFEHKVESTVLGFSTTEKKLVTIKIVTEMVKNNSIAYYSNDFLEAFGKPQVVKDNNYKVEPVLPEITCQWIGQKVVMNLNIIFSDSGKLLEQNSKAVVDIQPKSLALSRIKAGF